MRALPLLVFLMAGCSSGPHFRVRGETCDVDFLDYAGGLTYHLLQGKGDGSFDYDPEGPVEARVVGNYSLQTGDFSWETTFHEDHYREKNEIEGYGYAKTDGDLDVEYSVTREDVLGVVSSWDVREERVGCEVLRRINWPDGAIEHHEGTFTPGGYAYTDSEDYEGTPWIAEGTVYSDRSGEETVSFANASFTYDYDEVWDGEGYRNREWLQVEGSTSYDGYTETFLDGSRHTYYDIRGSDGDASWEYRVDYGGTGTGTYTEGGGTCTLTYTDGDCSYDCDGSAGSC